MNNNCKEIRVLTEILQVKDLTITEKMILSQIDALDQKEGCFASNNYFAELFLLSKTQISKIISDLKKKGWISVKYENKKNTKAVDKRVIKINRPPYPTKVKEGIKPEDNTPIKPQFKDNNKYINNKNSYMNYEHRDYSDIDWSKFYANF
jgi:hypothetical protein